MDPMMSLRKVAIHGVCHVGQVYTHVGFVIDSDLRDTLRYE
jgi:hypothetical protein